jgi:broad specificity phosphatase PhoE
MPVCTLHLIRHGVVEPEAHAYHYGIMDVALCPRLRAAQAGTYASLARRLPRPATWLVTPLRRTHQTAEAIFAAGYPAVSAEVEPTLIEQDIGDWHGTAHDELPPLLARPPHPFWPMAPEERPPNGESVLGMFARVAAALDRIADLHAGGNVVAVTHGGTVRAAVAHALHLAPADALRLAVDNLSLTTLEHSPDGWRVLRVNDGGAA